MLAREGEITWWSRDASALAWLSEPGEPSSRSSASCITALRAASCTIANLLRIAENTCSIAFYLLPPALRLPNTYLPVQTCPHLTLHSSSLGVNTRLHYNQLEPTRCPLFPRSHSFLRTINSPLKPLSAIQCPRTNTLRLFASIPRV